MGELINLRQARKAKRRAEDERQADANRLKHGRSKADRRLAEIAKERLNVIVDGARRDRADD